MYYFFGIFYFVLGRNGAEWEFLFCLFLGLFLPILAWNDAIIVFLNFFAFVLEFSVTRRVGTKLNDNFYFISFPSFSNLFLAWNEAVMVFFNFLNFFKFFSIFLEFPISRRVGTERNDNFYFLSFLAFSNLFWLEGMP